MIVGTHALIQEGVHYQDLGLVIVMNSIFGVSQRRILREKGQNPDVPDDDGYPIPGPWLLQPLEIWMCPSLIRCLPGTQGNHHTLGQEQLEVVLDWLVKELGKGSQAYFISPLIEESEALDLKTPLPSKKS